MAMQRMPTRYARAVRHRLKVRKQHGKLTKWNVVLARSYRDDIEASQVQSGAWSAPCDHLRPGQRDDAVCTAGAITTLTI